ncbi:MAG: YjbQ family protein [Puniceicoccaceae bacterium]|nr:MAG: YjbQ family protein [Puniceicoccaceae bacterium]
MKLVQHTLTVPTRGRGLYEISSELADALRKSGLRDGLLHVFCRHTSCSLVIMENADPTARTDLERFFDRLAPENDPAYEHTLEGPDDMPAHLKMALTRTSEAVPFAEGRLLLGTWQGVYLWEHRQAPHRRSLAVTLQGSA